MANVEKIDLVVVGAGVYGLATARTFLELHPSWNIVVLEEASTLGGVWAQHRLYPGLKTNNMLGTYEFPDFPMDGDTYGLKPGQHVPGHIVHQYLTDFARKFGVFERIRFNTKVASVEKSGAKWSLNVNASGSPGQIEADRLIVATGLTSEPFIPHIPGADQFGSNMFHVKDFKEYEGSLSDANEVVILGGTKSAFDVSYAYADAGANVHIVMREKGHGPMWMAPPYVTPMKKWLEKLVTTRFLTWMSPCIWGDADGYTGARGFLHGTGVGRGLVNTFWGILGNDVITLNEYDKHPETAKLKPWSNAMFIGSGLGILNYEKNYFDFVKSGKIKVHVSDIESLSKNSVNLANGERLTADTFVYSTGWKHHPPIKFLPEGIDAELGLPHYSEQTNEQVTKADNEILTKFPRLKEQPVQNAKMTDPDTRSGDEFPPTKENVPYQMYRFMVPPAQIQQRNLGFAGAMLCLLTPTNAQVQALWLAAHFDGQLPLDKDISYETVLHSRFGKWRYPAGHGSQFPDFVFDGLPYIDLMLGDLGLKVHRKGGSIGEMFYPYGPEDYRGLIEEWKDKNAV